MSDGPPDEFEKIRADLRRLWSACPKGEWDAPDSPTERTILRAGRGLDWSILALFHDVPAAKLCAAMHEALPRIFGEIDRLRAARAVPIIGTVGDGGSVSWTTAATGPR